MPQRIQRRRTRGWRMPPNTRYVGRGTKWGNPYTVQPIGMTQWAVVYKWNGIVTERTRSRAEALAQCLALYRKWVELQVALEPDFLEPLRGKDLACWCPLDQPCHATTLLELAAQTD